MTRFHERLGNLLKPQHTSSALERVCRENYGALAIGNTVQTGPAVIGHKMQRSFACPGKPESCTIFEEDKKRTPVHMQNRVGPMLVLRHLDIHEKRKRLLDLFDLVDLTTVLQRLVQWILRAVIDLYLSNLRG